MKNTGTVRQIQGQAKGSSSQCESSPNPPFSEAVNKSKEIIAAARADARKIIEDAKSCREEEVKRAHQEGLDLGRQEAAEKIISVERLRQENVQREKKNLLELVLSVAEEVIGDELRSHPDSILKRIERAASRTLNAQTLTLVVHPADAELVRSSLSEIRALYMKPIPIELVENSELHRGSARLETDVAVVEANIKIHFEAIRNALLNT